MFRLSIVLSALLFSQLSFAALTPVGLWKTIDEETNEAKSLVRISEQGGVLVGSVEKILNPAKQDAICEECKGDKKNQPILGLKIIEGATDAGDGSWQEGEILDPNNGKTYTLKLTPQEQGKVLEVRGYIAFFYRNQYWQRVE
ncbi:DUF2147 domain-containing protein [Pseudoalteromonas shioyasakiensis]|uniref:DUF2147 domain-containing protein n=1 Tax=Pseudoalteromonas shioyasakiensis TaxID=1190813 RepID=UPI001EFEF10E|nr:DUF2147 domain-containing protein [Pseudoalteromonas shioyasakiensis]MCG9733578.1 DUF2147 domain-containing protein [Pseudoalteromonas shioyasakiensis]